jgi:C1A family cysteine protease
MTDTNPKRTRPGVLFLLITLTQLIYINTDLQVHCISEDITGKWIFRIDTQTFTPVLQNTQTSCGHSIPNSPEAPLGDPKFNFPNYTEFEIELKADHKVYSGSLAVGDWTLVYDQSIFMRFRNGDKTVTLTSPFKYYKRSENDKTVSDCSKTMIGWFIPDEDNKSANWSCFFGFKKEYKANFLNIRPRTVSTAVLAQLMTSTNTNLVNMLKYEHLEPFVNKLNEMNLSWKAHINKDLVGLNFVQIRQKLGLKRGLKNTLPDQQQMSFKEKDDTQVREFVSGLNEELADIKSIPNGKIVDVGDNIVRDKDSKYVKYYAEMTKYLNTEIKDIDEKTLPKNWDWRNVGGVSYVSPVESQGNCGSCYVFAAITSLESRLRIITNNRDTTRFSKQFPISCSFYSEGCEGGYPFLLGKFFSEFEIVPEDCLKYAEDPALVKCDQVCDYTKYPKKYTVSKYEYLGGYYGATSEVDMMKELRARGPIPGSIRVPVSFNYYKDGIFSVSNLLQNNQKLSKMTQIDRAVSWEKVEHSVTIVGYGEDDGVKYWIIQNTWGEKWGEGGYFRLLRGENELSVESMGDILHLKVEDRK